MQYCPKSIKIILNKIFFLCYIVWNNIAYGFDLNLVPRVLRQPLNKIFSCALLSGASGTTLHSVLICAIVYQEYHLLEQHCTGKPYAMLPKRLQTTLYKKNSVQCCAHIIWATYIGKNHTLCDVAQQAHSIAWEYRLANVV